MHIRSCGIFLVALLFVAGLSACSADDRLAHPVPLSDADKEVLFGEIVTSEDSGYGYSIDAPIQVGRFGPSKGVQASYYMLSRLRKEGQPLHLLWRGSVGNPNASERPSFPPRRGAPARLPLLDMYVLTTPDQADTLALYFDIYSSGAVFVPPGLAFVPEDGPTE